MYQAQHGLTDIFLFKDSIKFSLKAHAFLLFQKSLRNLNHRQYSLTYIVHLENIDQFLSKAHIANGDQEKIWIETYFNKLIHNAGLARNGKRSCTHTTAPPKIILGVLLSCTLDIKIACLVLIFKLQH